MLETTWYVPGSMMEWLGIEHCVDTDGRAILALGRPKSRGTAVLFGCVFHCLYGMVQNHANRSTYVWVDLLKKAVVFENKERKAFGWI